MKRAFIAVAIVVAASAVLSACSGASTPSDTALMPSSAKDFQGEKYQDVVADLKTAGFTHVRAKAQGDLITGWLKHPGTVKEVDVDGSNSFDQNDSFTKDADIVVAYHSLPGAKSTAPANPTSTPTASEPAVLTVANSAALAKLVRVQDPGDSSVADFARDYVGKTIQLDTSIRSVQQREGTTTIDDVLVIAGDYDPDSELGPNFRLDGISMYDLPNDAAVGTDVRVVAQVLSYDASSELLKLHATSVTDRT